MVIVKGCGTLTTMTADSEDKDTLSKIANGNTGAFEEIISKYQRYVFAIVSKHVPRAHVTEVAHDVFVKAYQSLPSYQAKAPFKFWLATIAVRGSCDFWRKRKTRELPFSELSVEGKDWCTRALEDAAKANFTQETSAKSASEVLEWALQDLMPEDRIIVTMLHIEELPVKEIAQLLNWTVAKVKVRAFRARQILKRRIESLES